MSENTPAAGDPTPENLPDPAPAADEAAAPPPPPPPAPAPEIPAASDPVPPAPYAPAPAAPTPGYAAAPPPAPGYASAGVPAKNTQATWSLVTGIVSLFCCGFVLGIVAIVLGLNGKKVAAQNGIGGGMSTAGIVLGAIGLVGWAIYAVGRFTFLR